MSEEEVAKRLDETYMVRVLSVSPDGKPHIAPLWFVVLDGDKL
ncbi:MAG: pyridoxamine 5'-phosphate oxidase family protein [Candidatus Wukongarchaeota archaeon]|nr:pyridoxamine 5'-phosphate oxidase family protein [Candidatus Wukongarchaeota archaeon]